MWVMRIMRSSRTVATKKAQFYRAPASQMSPSVCTVIRYPCGTWCHSSVCAHRSVQCAGIPGLPPTVWNGSLFDSTSRLWSVQPQSDKLQ